MSLKVGEKKFSEDLNKNDILDLKFELEYSRIGFTFANSTRNGRKTWLFRYYKLRLQRMGFDTNGESTQDWDLRNNLSILNDSLSITTL